MVKARWVCSLFGALVFSSSAAAWAQCTKDTDCKGDRVCDAGRCTAPPPAAAPAAQPGAAPAATAPPSDAAPAAPETAALPPAPAAPPAVAPAPAPAPPPDNSPPPVRMERNSTGMMAAGIAMVSVAPFAFLGSAIVGIQKAACGVSDIDSSTTFIDHKCDDYDPAMYGLLLSGVVLVGAGIPLIVIGAKKVPVSENSGDDMAIAPWVSRDGAGAVVRWRM